MEDHRRDRAVLRELAALYCEIAALDSQRQNEQNWRALYSLKPNKPMFSIDQICWEELAQEPEMVLRCSDPFARALETDLRRVLYRWKYFPCDMVVPPSFSLGKIITSSGVGVGTVIQDETGHEGAQSHLYEDGIADEAALEALHAPVITYERERSEAARQRAEEYFGDILPVRLSGALLWMALWDRIVFWRGAEPVLYDLVDRPEFLHKLMEKLVSYELETIRQYEEQNLFEAQGALCHCLETYCDELPAPGYDPAHTRAADCWVSGAAQIFSEVSPAMHDEFEIEYMKPLYERFGLVNYGCCEPLHRKISIIRRIRNVRAISVSPWARVDTAAEAMGGDYVMARKPNPAFLAFDSLAEEAIRDQVRETLDICRSTETPVIFMLKDITTLRGDPSRLRRWHDIVKKEIEKQ